MAGLALFFLLAGQADATYREPRLSIDLLDITLKPSSGHGFYDTKEEMLYFFGGLPNPDYEMWKIDPDTLVKSRIWDNIPVNGYPSGDWTGQVYLTAGGVTHGRESLPTNKIYRYDSERQAISIAGELPETLFDGTGSWHDYNGELYIMGGYWGETPKDNGSYRPWLYTYSPEKDLLKRRPDLPRRGDNATSVYDPVKKVVYFIGGHHGATFFDDIIEVGADGTSQVVATLPAPVDIGGSFYYQGFVYIIGGRNYEGLSDAIYRFDTFTGEVGTFADKLPSPMPIYSYARSEDTYYILSPTPIAIRFR